MSTIDSMRRIVREKQARRVKGVFVDLTTASIVVRVFDKLNADNRAKFAGLSPDRMARVAFACLE